MTKLSHMINFFVEIQQNKWFLTTNAFLKKIFYLSFSDFFHFFGIIFGTLFGSLFHGILTPKQLPKVVQKWSQNQFFFGSAFEGIFLGFRAPSGRSFAVFWASWGRLGTPQERKNADSPMRKPLF